ncbi:MAG: VOC family protein [Acidimicrobiales bacterium]
MANRYTAVATPGRLPDWAVVADGPGSLRIGSFVLGVSDVARAMGFWAPALGYTPRDDSEATWVVLVPAHGVGPQLALALSETPARDHPRHHLDLYSPEPAAEIERLVGLGATRVDDWDGYEDDSDFVVLEDTEGNRFCVIDTRGR